MATIQITPTFSIDESEIIYRFVLSRGPGGQRVNKVSTAVLLRFNVKNSPSLQADIKQRLIDLVHHRLTATGDLLIKSCRFSSQVKNKKEALNRLIALLQKAAQPPKKQIKTKPTKNAIERRLKQKKKRSILKNQRKRVDDVD
jgi:ribosome-associated protein